VANELAARPPATISRRHDLDALRAVAMLLGIVLHGALSFIPATWVGKESLWIVEDSQAAPWAGLVFTAIHGFRMPLFFLISGFFTAMLWRKRGLKSLLAHRFRRIFLPLLIGMFTIVPAVWFVAAYVGAASREDQGVNNQRPAPTANEREPSRGPALMEAAVAGDAGRIAELLEQGVDVDTTDQRGSTALHVACLFGRAEAAEVLLAAGADTAIRNHDGRAPADVLATPWGLTRFIANLIQVEADREKVMQGRRRIAALLGRPAGVAGSATGGEVDAGLHPGAGWRAGDVSGLLWLLLYFPLFHHLWFLWFLCWLVAGFAICVTAARVLGLSGLPRWLIVSGWRYAWLIPLAALPQFFMDGFGPETSIGLLPLPHVLLYHAVFFAFGAFYYDANDQQGLVGRLWWITLPVALVVLYPIGMVLRSGNHGIARVVAALCIVAYAWLLSFGMMGLFRSWLRSESKTMRYVSDSSYWLYLAHVPLMIYIQYLVRDWQLTAWIKLPLICILTSGVLLISYQLFVRYTPIGTLLNGRRRRLGTRFRAPGWQARRPAEPAGEGSPP
jgi:peptidoglycan/LPS O-acetylase OafA/YrhL